MKLELVGVPVTDVDRAKEFYVKVGFNADHDHTVSEEVRFVQMTPPGSACSIAFGNGLTQMAPGSLDNLQMVVADADAIRDELVDRGVEVSDVDAQPWGRFVYFRDPDGNGWSLQELPGLVGRRRRLRREPRCLSRRTYPEGVTSWVDVEVPDLEVAQAFYGGLFGWTFEQVSPPDARRTSIARIDGQDVAGLASGDDPAWNTYVAVDDATQVAARVREHGGQVVAGPDARPGTPGAGPRARTRPACRSGSGRPAPGRARSWSTRPAPGTSATCTRPTRARPPRSTPQVFGWEIDDLGFGSMIRRPGYGDHLAATVDPGIHERQAGVSAPPGFADAIGWLAPAEPDESRTGTCRSRSPTATPPPPTPSGSAAPCCGVPTPTGPARRWSATRPGRCSRPASSRRPPRVV